MKGFWALAILAALLSLPIAQAARHRPSLASSGALVVLGALFPQSARLIEARPPHPAPPPHPPRPTPPAPTPPPPPPTPPTTENCTQLHQLSEGPYWIEENIDTSNVRLNVSYGVPLNITFKIANGTLSASAGSCVPIENVRIDLWQCRYDGVYSDEDEESTSGEKWLRGYQYTNTTGYASFYTIYPGWYTSRTVHIHVRVRIYEADGNTTSLDDTTQLYFDDTVTEALFLDVYPYNSRGYAVRDTFNANDSLFTETNVLTLNGNYSDSNGYSSVVELSLPFSQSISAVGNGKSITKGNSSSGGFSAIL